MFHLWPGSSDEPLEQSFTLYLDSVVHDEDHAIALGKTLSGCLLLRGAQLSVVKRLDGQHVVDIHSRSLNWVCKRLATYETAKNKKARNKAIKFFRVLLPFLSSIDPRDALKM